MPSAILYDDRVAAATLTGAGATVATMPLSNLKDPQPRMRTRFPGTTATVIADLLASTSIDAVAVLSTTVTAAATIRVRLSTADATGAAGDAWDTGTISAATGPDYFGQVVVLRSSAASGRYLRVDLVDGSLSQVDVGLIVAGPLWRMSRSQSYGFQEGRLVLDTRDRNAFTGAEFPVPAVANPRFASFQVQLLSTTEVQAQHNAMLARLGAARDALWIPDTSLTLADLNARCLWGAVAQPGETGATRNVFPGWSRSWRVVERV